MREAKLHHGSRFCGCGITGIGSELPAILLNSSRLSRESRSFPGFFQRVPRAGKRLMGFCRTNLFKRLESSGAAFEQSIERHILRNHIYLHAIENGLPLPLGTQDSGLLDTGNYDEDVDDASAATDLFEEDSSDIIKPTGSLHLRDIASYRKRAADTYQAYATQHKNRFKWLRPDLFIPSLAKDLSDDAMRMLAILTRCGEWNPDLDAKLDALHKLLTKKHAHDKVIVFTQFADTVRYLETQLRSRGVAKLAGVTGEAEDPTSYAWRFSPVSNNKRDAVSATDELRILLATDVLSEGQNLQDGAIIVNFDLPWAIIRLIQRAGRVDRIGQRAEEILCYSFLPADGVEKLIGLRARVRQRLHENAEVVGTDEAFFEDERERQKFFDLYHEKSGILDGDSHRGFQSALPHPGLITSHRPRGLECNPDKMDFEILAPVRIGYFKKAA